MTLQIPQIAPNGTFEHPNCVNPQVLEEEHQDDDYQDEEEDQRGDDKVLKPKPPKKRARKDPFDFMWRAPKMRLGSWKALPV